MLQYSIFLLVWQERNVIFFNFLPKVCILKILSQNNEKKIKKDFIFFSLCAIMDLVYYNLFLI